MLATAQEQKVRSNVYLDIEPIYPNDPDYKLIQDVKNKDTISLDEFMKL